MTEQKLEELIKEYFEQDNRGTRYPIYFTIRDVAYEPSCHFEEGDRFTMVWDCESTYTAKSIQGMFEQIIKDEDDYGFKMPEYFDIKDVCESDCEAFTRLNDDCHGIFSEKKVWKEKNMFLFSDEAKQHLKANYYHYSSEAHTYGNHAWRAPKTEALLNGLKKFRASTTKEAELQAEVERLRDKITELEQDTIDIEEQALNQESKS